MPYETLASGRVTPPEIASSMPACRCPLDAWGYMLRQLRRIGWAMRQGGTESAIGIDVEYVTEYVRNQGKPCEKSRKTGYRGVFVRRPPAPIKRNPSPAPVVPNSNAIYIARYIRFLVPSNGTHVAPYSYFPASKSNAIFLPHSKAMNKDQYSALSAEELRTALLILTQACIEYDRAICACANDPDRMSSYTTVAGEDLDNLYLRWQLIARGIWSTYHPEETP